MKVLRRFISPSILALFWIWFTRIPAMAEEAVEEAAEESMPLEPDNLDPQLTEEAEQVTFLRVLLRLCST